MNSRGGHRPRRKCNVDTVCICRSDCVRSLQCIFGKKLITCAASELIPKEHWDVPAWFDQTTFEESARLMSLKGVKYASKLSYRQMCRWYSGFFYKHPALKDIRYYWRVEPNIK
jgi:hypothetical protein